MGTGERSSVATVVFRLSGHSEICPKLVFDQSSARASALFCRRQIYNRDLFQSLEQFLESWQCLPRLIDIFRGRRHRSGRLVPCGPETRRA